MAAEYDSTNLLRDSTRSAPHIWTAPANARARDVVVLYNTTNHEWLAIGRIVHAPVRSQVDGQWWTYIQ